jgi:(2Fe-2S) ferredoxin
MGEQHPGWLELLRRLGRPSPPEGVAGCTVTVCRGCCCGTPGKHPGTDHAGQLQRLRAAVSGGGRIRQTGCLDLCDRSNVVVVSPSTAGRRNGGRPVWFAEVLDDRLVTSIADWIRAGGPGVAAPPPWLADHMFAPSRRVRHSVG